MRKLTAGFGIICGLAIVSLVARYGYRTSDTGIDGAIAAFIFGAIAAAGLGGHALAVRLWSVSKVGSVVVGLVCFTALVVNLSNSLGTIASRADLDAASNKKAGDNLKLDAGEKARIERELASLPAHTPTDAAAVVAAQRAADTASRIREAECTKRGPFCREREADERSALLALSTATTQQGHTEQAKDLASRLAAITSRIAGTKPIKASNAQGTAIANLFRLPSDSADMVSIWQQFAMATVLELLVVAALVSVELMDQRKGYTVYPATAVYLTPWKYEPADEPEPDEETTVVVPTNLASVPPPKPRLVSTSDIRSASPASVLAEILVPGAGRIEIAEVYAAYADRCSILGRQAMAPDQFAGPLGRLCRDLGIKTTSDSTGAHLVGVQITK